jgi:hypothetical protein
MHHISMVNKRSAKMHTTPEQRKWRAMELSARYLADANELRDRGLHEKAEKLYSKAEFWLLRFNKLNGDF